MLNLHTTTEALAAESGLVRVEETHGFTAIDQLATWCADPATQIDIHPILDLAGHINVDAYEVPDRLKAQTRLLNPTCVFPGCNRRAVHCDHDHITAHADGGTTCTCNIAPLCRGHHRLKTHGGWTYTKLDPTTYLWQAPTATPTSATTTAPSTPPDHPTPDGSWVSTRCRSISSIGTPSTRTWPVSQGGEVAHPDGCARAA